ncbi:hypothetical protein LCGC14_2996500, partial [marine sediment metagenome]
NNTALRMVAKGSDESFICEITGLSQEELDQLKHHAK